MNWNSRTHTNSIVDSSNEKMESMDPCRKAHNIAEHFMQFLEPTIATSSSLQKEVFKIRHKVYCEELGLEDIRNNEQEDDEFDPRSIFSLIKHKPSNTFTSCVRLVTSKSPSELLPIEKYCLASMTEQDFMPERFHRTEIAEISRLAVNLGFRRRKSDQFKGACTGAISQANYSETELRCFPFIALGLYMAAISTSMNCGIKHVYVMMEPRMARNMKYIGINFKQLGPPIDYFGWRAPYYINPEVFTDNVSAGFKSLYKVIEHSIFEQLNHQH